jgi:hypothetical protein
VPLRGALDSGSRVAQISFSMSELALPLRKHRQSLHAYVRANLRWFECERWAGVPYSSLAEALSSTGFEVVSVRSLQTAVYRATKQTCAKGPNSSAPIRGGEFGNSISKPPVIPSSPWQESPPQSSTREGRAEIARKLRELARPPKPGERDPLD